MIADRATPRALVPAREIQRELAGIRRALTAIAVILGLHFLLGVFR